MISVRRHLSKNRPGLPQKSSETPSTSLLVRGESPQGPSFSQGKVAQGPHRANSERRRGAFSGSCKLLQQLFVHEQDRRCHVSSHSLQAAFPARSCVLDPGTRRHAFGLRVSLRHPIFTTVPKPFMLADGAKETTALFVLFSFQYFLRLCPHDALHRFTALSGHWPFAGDSEVCGCQPMPLGDGTREWAYSLL